MPTLPEVTQFGRKELPELEETFRAWLKQTSDRPFAFITEDVRAQIFGGEFSAIGGKDGIDRAVKAYPRGFDAARDRGALTP